MTARPDILDLIDSAVQDHAVSGDAMRCSPEVAAAEPPRPLAAVSEAQMRIITTCAAWAEGVAAGLRRLNEQVATSTGSMRQFSETWTTMNSGGHLTRPDGALGLPWQHE